MMLEWNSLFEDIKNVILTDRPDTLVWKYKTKGLYTVKSFYNIVNFRGILPGVKPVVWKTKIPPRIQIFCWLITNNKLLTRDNLCKRQHVSDKTCLFCSEHESSCHLFFSCVVAAELWRVVRDAANIKVYEDIHEMMISWAIKPDTAATFIQAATMCSFGKLRETCLYGRWSGQMLSKRN